MQAPSQGPTAYGHSPPVHCLVGSRWLKGEVAARLPVFKFQRFAFRFRDARRALRLCTLIGPRRGLLGPHVTASESVGAFGLVARFVLLRARGRADGQ